MSEQSPYTGQITLRDGRTATVRPLKASDIEPLAVYFLGLSEDTRRRYGPHPFDRETAEKLCAEADHHRIMRFVAVLNDGQPDAQIIGYMILSRELWPGDVERYGDRICHDTCACFAPSIADAYQEQGIGTQMAQHVLACAREMGLKQIILMGGVLADNARARHFYEKLGFEYVGDFWVHRSDGDVFNYDMMLVLGS